MKSKKQLQKFFDNIKQGDNYYNFKDFLKDAKSFIKDVKTRNTVCSVQVSRSGMNRTFNFLNYNMLLNICYNNKKSFDPVKVSGCGMDMHWNLKYRTCEKLLTKKEIEKHYINLTCSSGHIL